MKKTSKPNEPQSNMPPDTSSMTPTLDTSSPDTSNRVSSVDIATESSSSDSYTEVSLPVSVVDNSADTSSSVTSVATSPAISVDNISIETPSPDSPMDDIIKIDKKEPPFPLVDPTHIGTHKPSSRIPFLRKVRTRHVLISLLSLFLVGVVVVSVYIWQLLDQTTHVVVPIVTGGGEISEGLLDDISIPDETVDPITTSGDTSSKASSPIYYSSWGSGRVKVFVDGRFPITFVEPKDTNVENILLIGVDSRSAYESQARTDSILVVSIDKNNNSIKMTSFMRDTQVKIPGRTNPTKLNEAYVFGGIGLLINTLNLNFDMDIQKFAMVDMYSAENIIDAAGGVMINVTKDEATQINLSLAETNNLFRNFSKFTPNLTTSGKLLLNGRQAVAYGRIRYIGSDTARTQRQRTILSALIVSFKASSASNKMKFFEAAFQSFETSMTKSDMLFLSFDVLAGMRNIQQYRVPQDGMYTTNMSNYQLVINYTLQLPALHQFIWGNTSGITISMPDESSDPMSSESSSMVSSTSEESTSDNSSEYSSTDESSSSSDLVSSSDGSSSDSGSVSGSSSDTVSSSTSISSSSSSSSS